MCQARLGLKCARARLACTWCLNLVLRVWIRLPTRGPLAAISPFARAATSSPVSQTGCGTCMDPPRRSLQALTHAWRPGWSGFAPCPSQAVTHAWRPGWRTIALCPSQAVAHAWRRIWIGTPMGLGLTECMEAMMLIKSGAPLPKASSVAPATAGDRLRWSEMSSKVGQKKASDATYMVQNRSSSQPSMRAPATGGLLHATMGGRLQEDCLIELHMMY
eukprot:1149763-Pelagomonas_calceolata.AAC.2